MIKKGDYLVIKPEWRDAGDEAFTWVARSDEQNGRVDISAVNWPTYHSGQCRLCASTWSSTAGRLKKATRDGCQIDDPRLTRPCVDHAHDEIHSSEPDALQRLLAGLTDVTGAPCVKPADPPVFCVRWRSSRR